MMHINQKTKTRCKLAFLYLTLAILATARTINQYGRRVQSN